MIVAAVAAVAVVGAGDEVMFTYAFEEGSSNDYVIKFSQEVDAGFFTMNVFADMEVTEKCIGMEGDLYKMEMIFNKVEASMMAFGKSQDAAISENLTGQSVMYTLSRNGVVDDMKAGGYIEGWQQISQVVEPILDTGYAYLPDKAIAQGGTWEPVEEQDPDEELKFEVTGQLVFEGMKKESGRECAYVKGEVKSTISGSTMTPVGSATAGGGGKGEYEFYFDAKNMLVVKLKGNMDIEMEMVPENGGDAIETIIGFTVERKLKGD